VAIWRSWDSARSPPSAGAAHSPFGAQGDELLAAVVEGAIQRAFGRDVSVVRLSREDRDARFLVTGPDGADRMRRLLASGLAWGEALTRLQTGGAS
jgi:hypothetical protein